jgi:hypothetical protein
MKYCKLTLIVLLLFLSNSKAHIIEICPNPYESDGAEYVKVFCDKNCSLTDGEDEIRFDGTVVAAKDRDVFFKSFGYYPDVEFSSKFALSNSGEEILLYQNGELIDSFTYGREGFNYLDDGVIYFRNGNSWDFRYQDWTSFEPLADYVRGTITVSPVDYRIQAEKELILASYTFTDFTLSELKDEGVKIEVFVDASPVGGIPVEEVEALRGINAHFLKSNSFKNFHYKFAVIDDQKVIITTENWKWDKRGYIVEFESENISMLLKNVLNHDIIYDGESASTGGLKGEEMYSTGKEFNFEGSVEVFILPDYNPVFDLISNATARLYIQVPYIDFQWFYGTPLLDSILSAAENGAEVKILLDGKYNAEKNRKTADFINGLAERRDLDLEARIMKKLPLHAKMVVADDKSLITSANFNKYGLKLNREVGIIIHSEDASNFLAEQFTEDWDDMSYNPVYVISAITILITSIAITYRLMKKSSYAKEKTENKTIKGKTW